MKRKRGHKKGKQKKSFVVASEPASNTITLNAEDNSGLDDVDNTKLDERMEVETPASTGSDKPERTVNIDEIGSSDRPVVKSGYGRVKVKLKSSKMLELQRSSSDVHTQSDTDKSSPQVGVEKQDVTEKMDDSVSSMPEMLPVSGKPSKKAGSIKIKSSRGLGSSSAFMNQIGSPIQAHSERKKQSVSEMDKTAASSTSRDMHQRERSLPRQDPQYNQQELRAALAVIKKVMKMDAAEPFNVPVDPVALGIPDYFDIIETPMDFGTICSNLEKGIKYMNSEDVFKDVQYIWENCYRYNNKGDYILDLMKRVKKNFTKYWMAGGLYSDQRKRINSTAIDQDTGMEGLPLEDDSGRDKEHGISGRRKNVMIFKQDSLRASCVSGHENDQMVNAAPSNKEKVHLKGSYLKNKTRRRHGTKRHKSDCLCAVCVVRRRRKEREENDKTVADQIVRSDGNLSQEFKKEETLSLENPCSEETSSNLERSPDLDGDPDLEEQGEDMKVKTPEQHYSSQQEKKGMSDIEMEVQKKGGIEAPEFQPGSESGGPSPMSEVQQVVSGSTVQPHTQDDDNSNDHEEESQDAQQHNQEVQQKSKGSQGRRRQTKMHENIKHHENPLLLELCRTLFPNDPKSVWTGPHSLFHSEKSAQSTSAIRSAVATFMK